MGKIKRGRFLGLDRQIITQILGDPSFYEACPEYRDLRETAEPLYRRYIELMGARAGKGCQNCGNRKTMEPAIQGFLQRTKDLLDQEGLDGTASLYRYVALKLGYGPDPLVMYHKTSEGVKRLTLGGQGCQSQQKTATEG